MEIVDVFDVEFTTTTTTNLCNVEDFAYEDKNMGNL